MGPPGPSQSCPRHQDPGACCEGATQGLLPAPTLREPSSPRAGVSASGSSAPAGQRGFPRAWGQPSLHLSGQQTCRQTAFHSWEHQSQLCSEAQASLPPWTAPWDSQLRASKTLRG